MGEYDGNDVDGVFIFVFGRKAPKYLVSTKYGVSNAQFFSNLRIILSASYRKCQPVYMESHISFFN